MITKTYQALRYQTYDMYVRLGENAVLVPFRGGTLRPDIKGTYRTSDPEMQAALDKDTSNGITFKQIDEFDDEEPTKENEEGNIGNEDLTVVADVKTAQAAKDYIIANVEGITLASLPNKTAVFAIAAQHKISFPNLPE